MLAIFTLLFSLLVTTSSLACEITAFLDSNVIGNQAYIKIEVRPAQDRARITYFRARGLEMTSAVQLSARNFRLQNDEETMTVSTDFRNPEGEVESIELEFSDFSDEYDFEKGLCDIQQTALCFSALQNVSQAGQNSHFVGCRTGVKISRTCHAPHQGEGYRFLPNELRAGRVVPSGNEFANRVSFDQRISKSCRELSY